MYIIHIYRSMTLSLGHRVDDRVADKRSIVAVGWDDNGLYRCVGAVDSQGVKLVLPLFASEKGRSLVPVSVSKCLPLKRAQYRAGL